MKCLNKVFQTIEINYTWMFSTFYIVSQVAFQWIFDIRKVACLTILLNHIKSFPFLSFKIQVPIKKVIQNATKKIEFMEREKHIYKRKWIKKVRRHQNIFIWIEVKYLLILVHPSLYFLSRITGILQILQNYVIFDFLELFYFW